MRGLRRDYMLGSVSRDDKPKSQRSDGMRVYDERRYGRGLRLRRYDMRVYDEMTWKGSNCLRYGYYYYYLRRYDMRVYDEMICRGAMFTTCRHASLRRDYI